MRHLSSEVHDIGAAYELLRIGGHTLPRRMPAILPGSLRPHHRPGLAWVYDEANREWTVVHSPAPRRKLVDRLRGSRQAMWWRDAERHIERSMRARFN